MPELPEVETVRQQLKALVLGQTIQDIKIYYDPIVKMPKLDFIKQVVGQTFKDIKRYGKYLFFEMTQDIIVSHLRMEGKYYLRHSLKDLTKHDHIVFVLKDNLFLTYHDVRKFGTMELIQKSDKQAYILDKGLGPEINAEDIDFLPVYKKIKSSERAIKSILLDQKVLAGLGNIYVDETLFLAKIHPKKKGKSLSKKQVKNILSKAKLVIDHAIELGGTTIRSYHSTLGIDGRFQNQLNVHTKKGQDCQVCGQEIVKIKVGGRGTYYCPNCQK